MDCERARDLILTDWADGELAVAESSALMRHLGACAACRALADRVTAETVVPLQRAPGRQPDPALWSRVQAGIRRENREQADGVPFGVGAWLAAGHRAVSLLFRPALAGLAVGACLVIGTVLFEGKWVSVPEAGREITASTVVPGSIPSPDGQDDVSWYTGDTNFENTAVTNANFGTAMEACFL